MSFIQLEKVDCSTMIPRKVWIDSAKVSMIEETENGTWVYVDNDCVLVKENAETIFNRLR